MFIKNDIKAVSCEELVDNRFQDCLFCSIECGNSKTIVGVCYRPLDSLSANDEGMYELLRKLSKQNCNFR